MISLRDTRFSPISTPLRVFPDAEAFARHMVKHVFAKGERSCWRQLFGLDKAPWRALDKPKVDALLEAQGGAQQEAYNQFAAAVDAGIKYAMAAPARICVVEALAGLSETRQETVHWMLAREGFLVCARRGAVRSAFFNECGGDTSAWNRYRQGLRALRVRAMKAASGQRQYRGSDNCWAVVVELEEHTVNHYSNASNPWPKPAGRTRPRDRALLEWLDNQV